MSNKLGRNDPCPCGSGKKYKRCCLPAAEAAARERAQQEALLEDDVFGDLDLDADDEGGEFFEIEDDLTVLDRDTITRVCYTRGTVSKLSDLRSGRGVRITEWEAPQIPQALLETIEREAVDALEGEWGDPKSDSPMQVDIIDFETETDVVSIEVFNRAICLIDVDSEEMRRLDRLCDALEVATPEGPDQSVEEGNTAATAAIVSGKEVSQPSAGFDISAVLKEHRRQGGSCALCRAAVTRASARKHLAACVPAHDASGAPEQRLVQIRATAPGLPAYWLDIEVNSEAKLDALDSFLRRIWLECCGHLSAFHIGAVKYFSRGYDFAFTRTLGSLGRRQPSERSMTVRVRDTSIAQGEPFEYEYDFGSTTSLQLKVTGERTGRVERPPVRLLVRNTPPVWPCSVCGQPAAWSVLFRVHDAENAFVCAEHRKQHACDGDEAFLPVVNSPRMGVCGYTGE